MTKHNLITKEKAKKAAKGELKNEEFWKDYVGSINDDLESYFNKLVDQKIEEEKTTSYFTPKLTKKELKLVEEKNYEFLRSFGNGQPDVPFEEMKKSDSKDKYVRGRGQRETIHLTLEVPDTKKTRINE